MKNIKVGDILKHKIEDESRKVLAICGDICALSYRDDFDSLSGWYSLKEIQEMFDLPKEKWKPEEDENYWYIHSNGNIIQTSWDNARIDNELYNFGNCFETKKEAEAKLKEVKEILNK